MVTLSSADDTPLDWKNFQDEVAHLFRIAGYEVKQDVLVEFKKVDLLVSERRLGKLFRVAVECKFWARALTQKETSEIYANYLPLVPTAVDAILIVTKEGIAESAEAMVEKSPHLQHLKYVELHANIMDFRPYLRWLVSQYLEDGLYRYYVPPRTTEEEDLAQLVENWLQEPTTQPIAILGSYGLGKTTFARFLANKYASSAISDATQRIPILIRLGEISNEQSLEGLLGKLFTATNYVKGFNFSTFLELNKLGRFLVLFDGFDEMKQTLSWNDFKYNLSEMNRLVGGKAKVLILGRPTAFLNDAEHNFALHGIRNTYELREHEWPDYREISIAAFSKDQMEVFLPQYLRYLIDTTEHEAMRAAFRNFLHYDIHNLIRARIGDIAKRPVQLKMIVEILPDYHGKLSELTVHGLYNYFISYVIERESYKLARRQYSTEQRRTFARDIAFWLWKSRESSVLEEAIPADIVQPYRVPGDSQEATTRDLVSASLLDRRLGGRFFFPHRSFQEFLVAESICEQIIQRSLSIGDIHAYLTPEVTEFLEGFVDKKLHMALAVHLQTYRGSLPLNFLKMFSVPQFYRDVLPQESLWVHILTALAVSAGKEDENYFMSNAKAALSVGRDSKTAMLILYATLIACRKWRNSAWKQPSGMIQEILEAITRLVEAERPKTRKKSKSRVHFTRTPLIDALASLNFAKGKGGNVVILTGLYRIIRQELYNLCYISDWDSGTSLQYATAELPERATDYRDTIRKTSQSAIRMHEEKGN